MKGAPPPPPSAYNEDVVTSFLCAHHGVQHVGHIVPFSRHPVQAWSVVQNKTVSRIELQGTSTNVLRFPQATQPEKRFIHPRDKLPMDSDFNTEGVWIYSIVVKHYKNAADERVAVRLNYKHEAMATLQETDVHDDLLEEGGGFRSAFMAMEAKTEADVNVVPLREMTFGYQSPAFIATTALLGESNIMNGIIMIPADVCVRANLGTWKGALPEPSDELLNKMMERIHLKPTPENKVSILEQVHEKMEEQYEGRARSTFMYAVPYNHVLAWALQSADVRQQMRIIGTRELRYNKSVLYYLVLSEDLHLLRANCLSTWCGKTDRRRLHDVAFELSSETPATSIRAYVSYYSAPYLPPNVIANLAPTMSPDMMPVSAYSENDVARDMALKQTSNDRLIQ